MTTERTAADAPVSESDREREERELDAELAAYDERLRELSDDDDDDDDDFDEEDDDGFDGEDGEHDDDAEYDDEGDDADDGTLGGLSGQALIDAFFANESKPSGSNGPSNGGGAGDGEAAGGEGGAGDEPAPEPNMHPATYVGPFKSGFVALVGRPNAGKSTLINAIVGDKLLITSPTAQTTRHRINAVYNEPNMQIVLVDTPGLHKPVDALGEELNISALNALKDVDVVAMLVDGSQEAGRGDEWVAQHVAQSGAFKILVVSKADIIEQDKARDQVARMERFCKFDDVIVLSAQEDFNVDSFLHLIADRLPEGPRWFPVDMRTDMSTDVLIAEFIREKVLLNTRDEVPHSVGVSVESVRRDGKRDLTSVKAVIYVEREGQKGIIIGAGGKMIKRIGSQARYDLQRLLGGQVYLDLKVKVKQGWRSDAAQIKRFGYGEGA